MVNNNLSDDEKYTILIGKYKTLRVSSGSEANNYLKAAMKLKAKGNVSRETVIGSAYL